MGESIQKYLYRNNYYTEIAIQKHFKGHGCMNSNPVPMYFKYNTCQIPYTIRT